MCGHVCERERETLYLVLLAVITTLRKKRGQNLKRIVTPLSLGEKAPDCL